MSQSRICMLLRQHTYTLCVREGERESLSLTLLLLLLLTFIILILTLFDFKVNVRIPIAQNKVTPVSYIDTYPPFAAFLFEILNT